MKLFVLVGAALVALLALASPASAHGTSCNSTMTGASIPGDLFVPENGACRITNSSVDGDVKVGKNAYFQATNSQIGGDIRAKESQTVFTEQGTTVGGDFSAKKTAQVFVFDSTLSGALEVKGATQQVNICGNSVDGQVKVKDSGPDILIGDPLTVGCAGNTVLDGNRIRVENNFVDVELVVRGNTLQGGSLEVLRNKGPADKFVQSNKGGDELECRDNETPFTASGNTGFNRTEGQCEIPPNTCTTTQTGATIDGDLVVPDNESCTLTNSTVSGNVKVGKNSFFQATNTKIGGDVTGSNSQTVFIDTASSVGGRVDSTGSAQVFVFNASVGDEIDVHGTTGVVNVCGNQVSNDIEVRDGQRDVLVGDSDPSVSCAGNTVGQDIVISDNWVDKELVVQANMVGGDLKVKDNNGPAVKFVTDNTGGDRVSCRDNESPFTGTPNTGFSSSRGQCE